MFKKINIFQINTNGYVIFTEILRVKMQVFKYNFFVHLRHIWQALCMMFDFISEISIKRGNVSYRKKKLLISIKMVTEIQYTNEESQFFYIFAFLTLPFPSIQKKAIIKISFMSQGNH